MNDELMIDGNALMLRILAFLLFSQPAGVIADRVMLIDFDHGVVEVERPIRQQGIYKRPVLVGHNCWLGYGVCILRGTTVGDNSILGTNSVVTRDIPANAVAGGTPARVLRMRDEPTSMQWGL